MIFETKRIRVRKLSKTDIEGFYALESNPAVLQYATGEVKTFSECEAELLSLINRYDAMDNDFWIFAVEEMSNHTFLGTVALVKDIDGNDEIGYRLLQRYWGKGFATELCEGLIDYCKRIGIKKLIGSVVDENLASAIILKRFKFKAIESFVSDDIGLPETKYVLYL